MERAHAEGEDCLSGARHVNREVLFRLFVGLQVDSGDLGIRVRGIRPRQDGMNSRLGRVLGLAKGVCRYSQINFHSPTTLDYMALSRASGPAMQSSWLFELFAWK